MSSSSTAIGGPGTGRPAAFPTTSSSEWPRPATRSRAGFNGPGQPANNWLAWEQVGRVEPSGRRGRLLGATRGGPRPRRGPRLQQLPAGGGVGPGGAETTAWSTPVALERYVAIGRACVERGLEPLVTLHHFTHPDWLGDDFWLRPDAPDRFRAWAEVAVDAPRPLGAAGGSPSTRSTSWPSAPGCSAMFPPGRTLAFGDAAIAIDNLLAAHVLGYDIVHRDPTGRRGHHQQQLPECLRLRPPAHRPAAGPEHGRRAAARCDGWLERAGAGSTTPCSRRPGSAERMVRRLGAAAAPYGPAGRRRCTRPGPADRGPIGDGRFPPGDRCGLRQPPRAHARRAGGRLLRPDGGPALPPARPPDRRWAQSGCRPGSCGTTFPTRPV